MPDNTTTDTHTKSEVPVTLKIIPSDIELTDWAFLREWADRLDVSLEVLLKRLLTAAAVGQVYVEKIPRI
jgi:hypothetical protein